MASITTRAGKGSPLTNAEMDANFVNLNTAKLEASSNLSDLASAATARTNLGLGTAATYAATAFATAAQGTKADGALQAASNLSDLASAATARTNLGLGTAATSAATAFATAAQGTKADGALQAASNLSDVASASTARTNLGLAIGTNVQAWDADLDAIAALTGTSGFLKTNGAGTWSVDTNTYLTSASTLAAGNLSGTIPSGVLGASTVYVGSTAIALNRASGSLALTGITSIDGNAATVTDGLYAASAQTISGVKTFSAAPVLNNNISLSTKDSGGTVRLLLGVWSDNTTNILNAGNSTVRILNQAGSAALVTLSDTSGNLTATGNVTAYSDERLKKNWRDLSEGFVEALSAVKHGVYDRTDDELTQVGVSAQSLANVLPWAVMVNDGGWLSVAYGNAAMASCVQLAKALVEAKGRIAALEQKVGA